MTDRFFSIRNWEKFQHYTKRNPPWIRLYQGLLRDRGYQSLSDTSRGHLVGLFLIASQHDNRIPEDQVWLKHELCTKVAIDLKALVASGWITYESKDASKMLADEDLEAECLHDASNVLAQSRADNSETDSSEVQRQKHIAETQMVAYGDEFKNVRLSVAQFEKLKVRLNSNLERFINKLDRYSQSNPVRFRKYKSHYAVILDWYESAVSKGEIATHARASPARPTEAEIAREHEAMFGGRKKVT